MFQDKDEDALVFITSRLAALDQSGELPIRIHEEFYLDLDPLEDVFQKFDDKTVVDVQFLVALALLKGRLISKCKQGLIEFEAFEQVLKSSNKYASSFASPVMAKIKRDVVLCDDASLKRQEEIFETYLDRIHKRNPIFLPAIVNPDPLMKLPRPVLTLKTYANGYN
jgi:hypothetical protein